MKHGADDRILDLPVVEVHADFVADFELSMVWLLFGWHAKECTPATE